MLQILTVNLKLFFKVFLASSPKKIWQNLKYMTNLKFYFHSKNNTFNNTLICTQVVLIEQFHQRSIKWKFNLLKLFTTTILCIVSFDCNLLKKNFKLPYLQHRPLSMSPHMVRTPECKKVRSYKKIKNYILKQDNRNGWSKFRIKTSLYKVVVYVTVFHVLLLRSWRLLLANKDMRANNYTGSPKIPV